MKTSTPVDSQGESSTDNASGQLYEHIADFNSDLEIHDNYITDFDAYESMLISKTYDSVSKQTKNGITDSDAATMVIERAARVVGQLPVGEVKAAGKKDRGKAMLMDILIQKYIYPNANAQRPFLDKVRLWELYSDVYGIMPMYYDWDVSPNGYVGPNCWLWSPRNFVPQQGRFTVADMDYVHAISYLSKKDIKDLLATWKQESGWDKDNLRTLLDQADAATKSQDVNRDSFVERQRNSRSIKGRIMIVTRYESGYRELDDKGDIKEYGHWVTFSPDFSGLQLRDIENPHKNGKIPFVIKPCIPLFDNFYGLSDMARAKPIQFAKDGLTNFYFQGIKMNIYPPTVVNAQGILKHTVSNEPGAIWEEIIPNSARRLETSTAGLATYQAAMGQMSGALQNVFGTTTTQSNADSAMSPQFGKTPEAIKYQTGRESSRDNQNRAYLQQAIEQLMDGMIGLFASMGTEKIPLDLFSEDIKEIQSMGYDDIFDMILPNESLQTGRIIIDPTKLKGVEYRFNMEPDSTIKSDKETQKNSLLELMNVLGKNANVLQELQQTTGKMPNWEQILTAYTALADIPGMDTVFTDAAPKPDPATQVTPDHLLQAQQQGHQQQMDMAKMAMEAQQQSVDQQPQSPIAPQSVNGMLFQDPTIHAVANDIHGMRQTNASK